MVYLVVLTVSRDSFISSSNVHLPEIVVSFYNWGKKWKNESGLLEQATKSKAF